MSDDSLLMNEPKAEEMETTLVTAAVIRDGDRFFLAQRLDNGLWEFPGGKMRPGEDARAALQREIREELGLEIRVREPLEVFTLQEPRHLVIIFFAADILHGSPRCIDCRDFSWVSRSRLDEPVMGRADRWVADRFHQGLLE